MFSKGIILLAIVVAATGRTSPSAGSVKKWLEANPQFHHSSNIEEDALLDVPGLIQKYRYPQETHTVTTSDGYILEAHRIPHGRDNFNTPGPRPIAFLMHGLLSSSADFVVLGPGNAIAYTLAEAGYDVWLGNARGNYYSRKHVSLNPDSRDQAFWRFSWDEIGNHDLPAFIDYILANTGQEKLHYIGHSQGGTTFLVLNSLRPEYNDKFYSFQGLAPAAYFNHNNVSMFNSLAAYESIIETAAFALGLGEVFSDFEFVNYFMDNYCDDGTMFESICTFGGSGLTEREYYNATMVPLFMAHAPAGASIRQFSHYAQTIRNGHFRRFNFNIFTNLSVYGSRTPPEYNLSRITVPSYIYYALSDNEVHYQDVATLGARLVNTVGLYQAGRSSFNHYDFIWAIDVKTLIYDQVVVHMKEAEGRQ